MLDNYKEDCGTILKRCFKENIRLTKFVNRKIVKSTGKNKKRRNFYIGVFTLCMLIWSIIENMFFILLNTILLPVHIIIAIEKHKSKRISKFIDIVE